MRMDCEQHVADSGTLVIASQLTGLFVFALFCMAVKRSAVNYLNWTSHQIQHLTYSVMEEVQPFKDEAQTALFKDPVRTAL